MRWEDLPDYLRLKRICQNPYEVLRFRKVKDQNKLLTVKLKDGHNLFIQGGTDQYHTFHRIYLRDEYQINQGGRTGMKCVVDLGANVGFFSTRMSSLAEKVICCEPIKSNVDKIKINCNGRRNIEIINKAVAGENGFINMFKPAAESLSCRYSMVFNVNSKGDHAVESVECITLDRLFEAYKIMTCDLVKMDIEGAEFETLYNANDHTLKKINRIVGEYHHFNKENKAHNIQALKTYLEKKRYRVQIVPKKRNDDIGLFFCHRH